MSPTQYSLTFSLLVHALLLIPVVSAVQDSSQQAQQGNRPLSITIQRLASDSDESQQHTPPPPAEVAVAPPPPVKKTDQRSAPTPVQAKKVIATTGESNLTVAVVKKATNKAAAPPEPERQTEQSRVKPRIVQQAPPPPRVVRSVETAPVKKLKQAVVTSAATDPGADSVISALQQLPATAAGRSQNNRPTPATPDSDRPSLLAKLESRYRSNLEGIIQAARKYPLWARRKGLQGEAEVEFTVYRNGQIDQITLIGASGHAILDKAALGTVSGLGRVEPIPTALARQQWTFRIPLHFHLN